MDGGRPRVLAVDDEPEVLEALRDNLRRHFDLATATSGQQAIDLAKHEEFAVIVSDMRMPGMDGATFLTNVREICPDATRVLLTGYADMDSALAAVNQGQIYRFLVKPCPKDDLIEALHAAVGQHRLVASERELLEQTLAGSIRVLTEILSLASPAAFGRATRAKDIVLELADGTSALGRWEAEMAAMLSQIACVTLPEETAERLYKGAKLRGEEQEMVGRLPAVTERLLRNIPRLETVRTILSNVGKPAGQERGIEGEAAPAVAFGSRALNIALDFDVLEAEGLPAPHAVETMRGRGSYDAVLLDALGKLRGGNADGLEMREVRLDEVEVGMTFAQDVRSMSGALLVPKGYVVTAGVQERLRNMRSGTAHEAVKVIVRRDPAVDRDGTDGA
jgi:CheY-like chemotaxis protein